jgi:hypothetical protein
MTSGYDLGDGRTRAWSMPVLMWIAMDDEGVAADETGVDRRGVSGSGSSPTAPTPMPL